MSESDFKLEKAPIVEAVVDIDCDMPPAFDPAILEATTRAAFRSGYPKFRVQLLERHSIKTSANEPLQHSAKRAVQALQLLHDDEKQLVQVRANGFSFNRLAPYTSLDDYLPEIQRTWLLFVGITRPVQIRVIHLRYINRILLPFADGVVQLADYFKATPHLPDEHKLRFGSFLNQYTARDIDTGHQINVVLASEPVTDKLSVVLDIGVLSGKTPDVKDWSAILAEIQSLRGLKNRTFRNTLTEKCLNLFQPLASASSAARP